MTKENLKKVEERWWAGINSTGFEMAEVFQLAERALEYESEENLPRQRKSKMKLYRKLKRAIANELGDPHFVMETKYYPWYYEEDFPIDMEDLVKKDNPFDGWYKYSIQEKYEEVETSIPMTIEEVPNRTESE